MIKLIANDQSITRVVDGVGTFTRSDFLCDTASDLTAMNASGSNYLNYPSGSMVYVVENGKRYILNGSCTEYVEVV